MNIGMAITLLMAGAGICLLVLYVCSDCKTIAPPEPIENEPKADAQDEIKKPVREFVRCFHANPRQFTLKPYCDHVMLFIQHYELVDTVRNHTFRISIHGGFCDRMIYVECDLKNIVLTKAEQDYLYEQIGGHYAKRATRLSEIKQQRIRNRLAKSYA